VLLTLPLLPLAGDRNAKLRTPEPTDLREATRTDATDIGRAEFGDLSRADAPGISLKNCSV
jgi:hypothetical protein